MMSLEPEKRVVAVLEITDPLPLVRSVSARFIHLSLSRRSTLCLVWIRDSKDEREERDTAIRLLVLLKYYHRVVSKSLRQA
jgi:hypothetical protein